MSTTSVDELARREIVLVKGTAVFDAGELPFAEMLAAIEHISRGAAAGRSKVFGGVVHHALAASRCAFSAVSARSSKDQRPLCGAQYAGDWFWGRQVASIVKALERAAASPIRFRWARNWKFARCLRLRTTAAA
ncbi:hypothetical protein [Aquincola tertiaricarbonis]|uniref:hypothetical protein n=1 Tax=Aquincola tertiaricarbonis TaxID=391953 RepID=UPI0012ED1203|nr:hypothetical protein [Aquincola tertiaricarbonis]